MGYLIKWQHLTFIIGVCKRLIDCGTSSLFSHSTEKKNSNQTFQIDYRIPLMRNSLKLRMQKEFISERRYELNLANSA